MSKAELEAVLATVTSFAEALAAIHAANYTGSFTVHCFSGAPQELELPPDRPTPFRVRLAKTLRSPKAAPAGGLTPSPSVPHSIG